MRNDNLSLSFVQVTDLARYTSLLVDSRGTGDSEGPFGWWSMKDMATDVVELLNKLDWTAEKSLHLVGHSMGGMQSQEIVRFPSFPLLALHY